MYELFLNNANFFAIIFNFFRSHEPSIFDLHAGSRSNLASAAHSSFVERDGFEPPTQSLECI
jgi:hypothetical protein